VGKAFLTQLSRNLSDQARPVLVFVSRSSKNVVSADYQPVDASQSLKLLDSSSSPMLGLAEIAQYLSAAPGPAIVVDNTSSQAVAEAYSEFLKRGVSVVTPNKKAFSSSYALWQSIFSAASKSKAMVYHESSVGAGLPVISTLKDLIATGDQVTRIEGVFSGTMSYLFNTFSAVDNDSGAGWSQIVAKAKEAGFTEPDPREDLNGMDVARKLTILARLAGLKVESPSSFPIQSLIPQALEGAKSADEFMKQLPDHDKGMDKYKSEAKQANKVLRYVGSIDVSSGTVNVGVRMVDLGSPMANLKGSDNLICFFTERYGENALVIQGAGAGGDVTAMGVTADLIKVVERLRRETPQSQ
jgi:homoserine dehydrogenase